MIRPGGIARKIGLLGLALVCVLQALPAVADLQYEPGQTDQGIRYLAVKGEFAFEDDLSLFRAAVATNSPTVVVFHSLGGNPTKAMELGRLIRSYGLVTVQFRGLECASACSLAFFGGVSRFADSGSIGVHKSYYLGNELGRDEAVSNVQALTAETIAYMTEMGVDPALLQVSLQYDSDDMRYLSKSEMQKYRVTTEEPAASTEAAGSIPQPVPSREPQSIPPIESRLSVPTAKSGRIRHPKGTAPLKAMSDGKSANVAMLRNGTRVDIVGSQGRWYAVQTGGLRGYMHDTWVFIDQFESGPFAQRHIQVKSVDNLQDAESLVRSSSLPLSAYLVTNGWFAITLRDTYDEETARQLVSTLKEQKRIPADSFMAYGNTYVRRVCCN